jgi:hypothetical protein
MRGALRQGAPAGLLAASNPRNGRAFVFSGSDGALLLTLAAPNPQADKRLGHAVAGIGDISGDQVPDLAVGAPRARYGSKVQAGRVYLFSGADGSLLRTVPPPSPARRGRFGFSLAAVPDPNGDLDGDFVVGSPRAFTPGRGRTGEAYLVSGLTGSVLTTFASPSLRRQAHFSWSVAAGGSATGLNPAEILIGAPAEEFEGRLRQGRAYLYDPNGVLLARINDPKLQRDARFGVSVSFMPDADGDGLEELLIGADAQKDSPGDYAGRVFIVFDVKPTRWIQGRRSPVAEPFANFGFQVVGLADIDGDLRGDFVATAPDQTTVDESAGAAWVMSGDPNRPGPLVSNLGALADPDPQRFAFFGGSAAALGDLTGDGLPEVAVGAELHRGATDVRAGRVYVFELESDPVHGLLVHVLLVIESPTGDGCARFGWSVASAGDVDGDGVEDLIVGAPYHRLSPRPVTGDCL